MKDFDPEVEVVQTVGCELVTGIWQRKIQLGNCRQGFASLAAERHLAASRDSYSGTAFFM